MPVCVDDVDEAKRFYEELGDGDLCARSRLHTLES